METIFHPKGERGHANHGWLKANHSFSFAKWYDPDKVHFGALRVLNDDLIAPHMGFGEHPHDNMEIITIPLSGKLRHRDSMGHEAVIESGEVQVMSAGTGVRHSEFNAGDSELSLFQIWIFPDKQNVTPRYDQINYNWEDAKNKWLQVVSPSADDEGTWIHQQAWIHLAELDEAGVLKYKLHNENNGAYLMVISGSAAVSGHNLSDRDAVGIGHTEQFEVHAKSNSRLLLIEVPLQF